MPEKPTALSINLLPGKEEGFGEKFLEWSLTFGRYIIIGTEIIVLVAFLSRFKLDRDLIDLSDKVKEKQKILESLRPIEESVTALQKRLSAIASVEGSQGSGILVLPNIALVTPPNITYQTILVDGDKVTITGVAPETADIATYVATLKASSIFKEDSVSLEKVERTRGDQKQISFIVSALAAKKGNKE